MDAGAFVRPSEDSVWRLVRPSEDSVWDALVDRAARLGPVRSAVPRFRLRVLPSVRHVFAISVAWAGFKR